MRAILACLVFLCSLGAAAEECECAANFALSADEQAIVDQTNAQRQKAGLPRLKPNAVLFGVARKHAEAMAKANDLNHRLHGKNSGDRVDAAGYKWTTVSENIAFNQRTVAEVMDGWMRSEGHRTNLLARDISEMGCALAADSKGQIYWVQVFAQPEAAKRNSISREFSRNSGPTTTTQFSIKNTARETVSVDVHVGKEFVIKPGETVTYTLNAPGTRPPVEISSGPSSMAFNAKNGARYTIGLKGAFFELVQDETIAP